MIRPGMSYRLHLPTAFIKSRSFSLIRSTKMWTTIDDIVSFVGVLLIIAFISNRDKSTIWCVCMCALQPMVLQQIVPRQPWVFFVFIRSKRETITDSCWIIIPSITKYSGAETCRLFNFSSRRGSSVINSILLNFCPSSNFLTKIEFLVCKIVGSFQRKDWIRF